MADREMPQEQKLDRETIERWRREAVTTSAQDRLWPNRCEALCNALAHANARLARFEALKGAIGDV